MSHEESEDDDNNAISRRRLLKLGVLGGCAAAGAGGLAYWQRRKPSVVQKQSTVILITLDTTRTDHLGCYGYNRDTSPNIDRLAEDSLVFDRAIAPGTWTLPSHASLFTGKFVSSHGAQFDPEGELQLTRAIVRKHESWDGYRARSITTNETTIASTLKEAGFVTGAVVAGPWLKRIFGLNKGFDFYDDSNIIELNGRPADNVTDSALKFLNKTNGQSRFLFLNYFDPHAPLRPPLEYAHKFLPGSWRPNYSKKLSRNEQVGLYDAEIRFMDYHFGRLMDWLRKMNVYRDALIVVTADHGTLLGEHGEVGHGSTPYQEVIHVPMIVKEPGDMRTRDRSSTWVQLVDVLPMMFQRLNIAPPPGIQGNLPPQVQHPILIESRTLPSIHENGHWLSVIHGDTKYVWNSKDAHMMFDLDKDPDENQNLFDRNVQQSKAAINEVTNYLANLPKPGAGGVVRQVDQKTLDTLKGLGYIE